MKPEAFFSIPKTVSCSCCLPVRFKIPTNVNNAWKKNVNNPTWKDRIENAHWVYDMIASSWKLEVKYLHLWLFRPPLHWKGKLGAPRHWRSTSRVCFPPTNDDNCDASCLTGNNRWKGRGKTLRTHIFSRVLRDSTSRFVGPSVRHTLLFRR